MYDETTRGEMFIHQFLFRVPDTASCKTGETWGSWMWLAAISQMDDL